MKTLFAPLIGRFGNQAMVYCHARKRAELEGATLCTPPWVGERIFDIPEACRDQSGEHIGGYRQRQEDLIYSRREVLQWLRLRPEIQAKLDTFVPQGEIVAHVRRGDYADLQYPLVSKRSYYRAADQFGFGSSPYYFAFVTEEEPLTHPDFTGDLAFLPDFYRMMRAKVLLRGNSSFSWFAGTLGEARVFSPCIKDKPGGVESDCEFSEGNHERLCNLPGFTDLHLFRESERYEYDLKPNSRVLDIGGYNGDFAFEIERRYRSRVMVYEASLPFSKRIAEKSVGRKVEVRNAAVGRDFGWLDIHIKGDMTGAFADGPSERCPMIDAASLGGADLLKINCEGGEYDILERLLETERVNKYRWIQVQFHRVVPDYMRRYVAIREGLLKTHRPTFQEPFCWEGFELR
jgi:FkbM family methyltransferase